MVTCAIADCEASVLARGWCAKHYRRWAKHGDTAIVVVPPQNQPRFAATCAIDGCSSMVASRRWCLRHYTRWLRYGDPTRVAVRHNWTGPTPTYRAAHKRIEQALGKARERACVDCGAAAAQWSFSGDRGTALRSPEGRPYSIDPGDYQPRCTSCHKRLDDPHPVGLAYRWAARA